MSKPWLLVTPASRGIGLQLARRLLRTTTLPLIATARKDIDQTRARILEGLDDVDQQRLEVLKLDVCDESSISTAASHCTTLFPPTTHHLRLAFLIPGILHPEKAPSQISHDNALSTFRTNTLGPLLLTKHFTPFLPRKSTPLHPLPHLPDLAVMALMSARVGSISDNRLGGWYSYRASKAAVNSIAKSMDIYLKQRSGENAVSLALHPGTVKTDLSFEFQGNVREDKLFNTEFAAERLCKVVRSVGVEGRGRCWDWAGKEIPP